MKEYYVRVTKTVGAIVKIVGNMDEDEACLTAEIEMENDTIITDPLSTEAETIEQYSSATPVDMKDVNPHLKYQTIEY